MSGKHWKKEPARGAVKLGTAATAAADPVGTSTTPSAVRTVKPSTRATPVAANSPPAARPPAKTPSPIAAGPPAAAAAEPSKGQFLVVFLRAQVGKPNLYGDTGPAAFDCSGQAPGVSSQGAHPAGAVG